MEKLPYWKYRYIWVKFLQKWEFFRAFCISLQPGFEVIDEVDSFPGFLIDQEVVGIVLCGAIFTHTADTKAVSPG